MTKLKLLKVDTINPTMMNSTLFMEDLKKPEESLQTSSKKIIIINRWDQFMESNVPTVEYP